MIGVSIGSVHSENDLFPHDGELTRRWPLWSAIALIVFLVLVELAYIKNTWPSDIQTLPLWWQTLDGVVFALFNAAMAFAVLTIVMRFAGTARLLLDAMHPSAYGIFLLHYVFVLWLQYAVFDQALPAVAKFTIAFVGALSLSWLITHAVRKIPAVARII